MAIDHMISAVMVFHCTFEQALGKLLFLQTLAVAEDRRTIHSVWIESWFEHVFSEWVFCPGIAERLMRTPCSLHIH